jgi:hypothetical protein
MIAAVGGFVRVDILLKLRLYLLSFPRLSEKWLSSPKNFRPRLPRENCLETTSADPHGENHRDMVVANGSVSRQDRVSISP